MKQFVLRVLLLLALVVVADRTFGLIMDRTLAETNKGDWGRNNYLMKDAVGEILIAGSSRAVHHYDAGALTDSLGMKCINAGEDGMGVLFMKTRLFRIIERHSPKLIIYDFLPEYDIYKEVDNTKYLKYLRPYAGNDSLYTSIIEVSPKEHWKLMSQMYKYNSIFLDIIVQHLSRSPITSNELLWAPLKGVYAGAPLPLSDNDDKLMDPLKEKYLRDIAAICKEKGFQLVFVVSPCLRTGSFKIPDSLTALCDEYSIPFVNHFADPTFLAEPTLFADPDHLNERGASLFTSLIVREVKEFIDRE